MKILKKRLFAYLIDCFIIACIMGSLTLLELPLWFWFFSIGTPMFRIPIPSLALLLTVALYYCKDLVFRNASIGKKILRLTIVTIDGKVPSCTTIIKRCIWMSAIGFALYHFNKEELLCLEEEKFYTKVIMK